MRWKIIAGTLALLSLGALAISWTQRELEVVDEAGWTSYTPLTGQTEDGEVYEYPLTETEVYDAYDWLGATDAVLWLGVAVGLAAAALVVAAVAFWPRRPARQSTADG